METKTVREWFESAEQPYKKQLFTNTVDYFLELEVTSLVEAVGSAFIWGESPEKQYYWKEYVNSISVPRGTK